MIFQKKIYIFLNNKIISCDTIVPIAQEIKNKNNSIKIFFYVFNKSTYDTLKQNKNLYSILSSVGSLHLFGWKARKNNKIANVLYKIIDLSKILLNSFLCKSINIHFKALEKFPLNLVYYFNIKNTFFFDSNSWGTEKLTYKTDALFYKERKIEDSYIKNYNNLVAFNHHWHQIEYAKNKKKNIFIINSTRILPKWNRYIEKLAYAEEKLKPKWLQNKKKNIIYILGSLDNVPTLHKNSTGATLLIETIDIIIKNSDFNILLKPHAITDIKKLEKILSNKNKKRIFIVYNHVAVLSKFSTFCIANYFSYAMPDAWVNNVFVIEYSHYSREVLKISKNNSVVSKYVDQFINKNPKELNETLNRRISNINRNIISKNNQITELLIDKLSS